MPELPEVETVRRGLELAIKGAVIEDVLLRRGDLRVPFPPDFSEKLAGRTIERIGRRAKYLLFYLDSDDILIIHLGMSGRFLIEEQKLVTYGKHDHIVFFLGDGRCLIFNDARRFGIATLTTKKELPTHPFFAHLGPEPFGDDFSPAYLKAALKRRKGPIKPALMDQALVVGVGNIYASEALFLAKIRPDRACDQSADKAGKIIAAIRSVLTDAIESGGSSLRDFLHITGKSGYFQHRFNVYGRAGEPCHHCQNPIQIMRQAGRSSFYCAHCQK